MFEGLSIDPRVVVVKDGRDASNEIDGITGATISSKAVARIINQGTAFWADKLPAPGDEPVLALDSASEGGEP
jgi:Na+-translocating ferredoxin:NAD+ oxidoreductase RnfG subunit